jgi:predicted Holliday junction resolvase-like endonuclease
MIILTILLLVTLGGVIYHYNKKIDTLKKQFEKERSDIRVDAKKRSGAVQWGKTIEHFVPFMSDFPVPPEDVTFLGMPIDYVGFSNTASKTKCPVHFVEVKSGNAFLMGKQKNIKTAIQEGRVYWHEISVGGNNVK